MRSLNLEFNSCKHSPFCWYLCMSQVPAWVTFGTKENHCIKKGLHIVPTCFWHRFKTFMQYHQLRSHLHDLFVTDVKHVIHCNTRLVSFWASMSELFIAITFFGNGLFCWVHQSYLNLLPSSEEEVMTHCYQHLQRDVFDMTYPFRCPTGESQWDITLLAGHQEYFNPMKIQCQSMHSKQTIGWNGLSQVQVVCLPVGISVFLLLNYLKRGH